MAETACTVRFERDARGERAARRLRVGAALLVTFAGLWLLALPFAVPRAFGVAGLVFAALWIARALRERRASQQPGEHCLELTADCLRLRDAERVQEVPWSEVESIWIDEDRLLVRVQRRSGAVLDLEPCYRGVGLQNLALAVEDARARAARGHLGCAPPQDG
jgi:hypothetical protein